MKKTIIGFLIASFMSSITMAGDINSADVVTRCPEVEKLIKGGLSDTMKFKYAKIPLYLALKFGSYETPWEWAFVIAIPEVEANTPEMAMALAQDALSSIKGNPSPVSHEEYHRYVCMYDHEDYFVLAVTPATMPGVDTAMARSPVMQKIKLKYNMRST